MAKEIMKDRDDAQKLGLSDEEMAFYDAITQPQAVKDFYDNDQLVSIARELTDAMRSNATIDWQKKESARAGMRRAIKRFAAQIQVSARRCRGRHEDRHGTVRAVGRHQDQRIGRAGG